MDNINLYLREVGSEGRSGWN